MKEKLLLYFLDLPQTCSIYYTCTITTIYVYEVIIYDINLLIIDYTISPSKKSYNCVST